MKKFPSGKFKCFVHDDSNPSANLWQNDTMWKCFACGAVGDIFDACVALEGRPASGKPWITDTLLFLASEFGVKHEALEISEEEQIELETYRAHMQAARPCITMPKPDAVEEKIARYGWSEKTLTIFGIGSVSSTAEYLEKMEKAGYSKQFLHQVDLDNPRIFNPNCLIFSVKDESGNVVGFSARNLLYDAIVVEAKQIAEDHGKDSVQAKEAREKIPQKFINSTQIDKDGNTRNSIYQKGKRLFGIHMLKGRKTLYIFEGNADVVSAFNAGLTNAVATCSNKLTKDHLNLILDLGINNLIFVMDGDAGGDSGREQFLKLVDEHLYNRPGFRIQLVLLENGDDPDSFIREKGLNAFLDLKKTSLFYWRMRQALEGHEDSAAVAEHGIGLIVNETDPIQQHQMLVQLADVTGIPMEVLNRKVQDVLSSAELRSETEISALVERLQSALKRNPRNAVQIVASAQVELERLKTPSRGATTASIVSAIDDVFDRFEAVTEEVGLKTGWPLFDKLFGGIPAGAAFLTIPGKPNQGKTSWLVSASVRTLDCNNDSIVLFHTIDDHLRLFLSRVCAVKYRYPSKWFQTAGKFARENEQFRQAFYESKQWLRDVIEGERFIPLDVTMLPRTLSALEAKVKALRRSYPSKPILVVGDNFHLYQTISGEPDGESKTRNMSMAAKTLANTYDVCLMMTMELPKGALKPGERPRMMNIKGTAGLSYDASGNIGVYNDLKDFREQSQLVWSDGGVIKPVIELIFDKSKLLNGFDGNIYYKLYPESGYFEEIPKEEQHVWASKATARRSRFGACAGSPQLAKPPLSYARHSLPACSV